MTYDASLMFYKATLLFCCRLVCITAIHTFQMLLALVGQPVSPDDSLNQLIKKLPGLLKRTFSSQSPLPKQLISALHVLRKNGNQGHFQIQGSATVPPSAYNFLLVEMSLAAHSYHTFLQALPRLPV
jgi:hypothetical protein